MLKPVIVAVSAVWIAFELWLFASRRADASATRKDADTLKHLNLVIYASVTVAVVLSSRAFGHVALPVAVRWCGVVLIVAGLAVRFWAIRSLRQFFTVDVAVHEGHRIVQAGPYRLVRHPSYTGVLLSFAGLAVCMANWLSAFVLLVPITAVFLHRIRVEERVLTDTFPVEYPDYCARTRRLVPGVY